MLLGRPRKNRKREEGNIIRKLKNYPRGEMRCHVALFITNVTIKQNVLKVHLFATNVNHGPSPSSAAGLCSGLSVGLSSTTTLTIQRERVRTRVSDFSPSRRVRGRPKVLTEKVIFLMCFVN